MHSVLQASDGYQYAVNPSHFAIWPGCSTNVLFGNIQGKTFYSSMDKYNANNYVESDIIKSAFLFNSSIINKLFMCVSVGCSFIGDTHLSEDKPLEFCEFKRIAYFWFCNQSQ